MTETLVSVRVERDDEAGVWFVDWSSLPGRNAEADTLDALMAKLPMLIADLVDVDDGPSASAEVSIELTARGSSRVLAHS